MLTLYVVPLNAVDYGMKTHTPDTILSVMPPSETSSLRTDLRFRTPRPTHPCRHVWIAVHDSHCDNHNLSPEAIAETLQIDHEVYGNNDNSISEAKMIALHDEIDLILSASREKDHTALIHCHGGISRSQAAAFALIARMLGKGREEETLDILRSASPWASPNPLMVWHLDRLMHRNGALCDVLKKPHKTPPDSHAASGLHLGDAQKPLLIPFFRS